MSNKQEIIWPMLAFAVVFLLLGTVFGHMLFPRTEWYKEEDKSPIYVEHNGEGVTYRWDNKNNIYKLYFGIGYDNETNTYYWEEGSGRYYYAYPYREGSGLPKIPPMTRHYEEPNDELYTLTVKFTIDKDFKSCFIDWCNNNLADMFNNVSIKCVPEVHINNFEIVLNEEKLK